MPWTSQSVHRIQIEYLGHTKKQILAHFLGSMKLSIQFLISPDQFVCRCKINVTFTKPIVVCIIFFFCAWEFELFIYLLVFCLRPPPLTSSHGSPASSSPSFCRQSTGMNAGGGSCPTPPLLPSPSPPWCLSTNWATSWDRGQTGKGGMHGKRPLRQASVRFRGGVMGKGRGIQR